MMSSWLTKSFNETKLAELQHEKEKGNKINTVVHGVQSTMCYICKYIKSHSFSL